MLRSVDEENSNSQDIMTQRVLRFQNTYRLEARNPFNRDEVEKILANVMENHFSSIEKFDATSVAMCRFVTDFLVLKKELFTIEELKKHFE